MTPSIASDKLLMSVAFVAALAPSVGALAQQGSQPGARLFDYRVEWQSAPRWSLSARPAWTSATSGTTAKKTAGVNAAFRQRSGSVVALNKADGQVSLFDQNGRFVRVLGEKGAGPGQYLRGVALIPRSDDAFLAMDGAGRIAEYDKNGKQVGAYQLRDEFAGPYPREAAGTLPDGSLIIYKGHSADLAKVQNGIRKSMIAHETVIQRDSLVIARYDRAGAQTHLIGPFLGRLTASHAQGDGVPGRGGTIFQVAALPVTRERVVTVGRAAYFVARDAESEVAIYSVTGDLRATVRMPVPLENRSRVQGKAYPISQTRKAGFMTDDGGDLWYEGDSTSAQFKTWLVLAPTGELRARIEIPIGVRVLSVSQTHVLGVRQTDDTDVIEAYQIVR